MSLGFSVTELVEAIAKCRDIYTTFTDEYECAPSRIKELVDTCKYLRAILEDFESLLGDIYSQGISFGRKLDECNAFISKYKSLKEDYLRSINETRLTSKARYAWDRAWQTGQFAFDGNRARDLKDALSLEIQKLVLFILVFALRRTVPVNPSTSLAHRIPQVSRSHSHEINTFEELFARLQSVRYLYEREMSIAVQQNRPPSLIGLHEELESGWHALCVRAGLIRENGQAPRLQTDRLLEAPSQNLNELLVNLSAPSTQTAAFQQWPNTQPRLPLSVSQSDQSISQSWQPAPSSASSPSTQDIFQPWPDMESEPSASNSTSIHPRHSRRASSLQLSEPLMPSHIAEIILPFQDNARIMRLRRWDCHRQGDVRKIVWAGENPAEVLEHYLPPNVFPDTLHSSHEDILHVSFPEPHFIKWMFKDGIPRNQHIRVEYDFLKPELRKEFQGAIRGKTLVETFDFDVLYSKRTPKENGGEAVLQDLKIWQDQNPPYHHSLSFLVTTREELHLEFPFIWFRVPLKQEPDKPTTVSLEFIRRKQSRSTSDTPRRRSTLQRVASWGRSRPPSDETLSAIAEPSVNPESSSHLPPADLANEYKFLTIKFTTKREADTFVKIFENAHSEDQVPLREPSYNARRSSGIRPAESPILDPLQSASTSSPRDLSSGLPPIGHPNSSPNSTTQTSSSRSPISSASPSSVIPTSASQSSISSVSPQIPPFDFQNTSPMASYFS